MSFGFAQLAQKNAINLRQFKKIYVACYCTKAEPSNTHNLRYGYSVDENDEGRFKKDKSTYGVLHISTKKLPVKLKESLDLFLKNQSKKQVTEDGLRLGRYLRNRGRPTHLTWQKYKEKMRGAKVERFDVKKFDIEEAKREKLIENYAETENNDTIKEHQVLDEKKDVNKHMKRPNLVDYSMIRYGKRETAAFVASQLPAVYGATYKTLHEIHTRLPDYQPKSLLDFGSGAGMSVWAANEIWKDSIREYQCVDISEDMNEAAEFLLRGGRNINVPLKIPNVYFKRFLPLSNQIRYDVAIAAYTLTEMPFRKQRMEAIKSLWRKVNDFLIVIEPGNNDGFESALLARQFITEMGKSNSDISPEYERDSTLNDFHNEDEYFSYEEDEEGYVFAPCPHQSVCARNYVETRDHPCNFSQNVEISFAQRNTKLKKYNYLAERYSYIILKKGKQDKVEDTETGWTRILKPVQLRKRHVNCELCCSNGNIEKHVFTKRKDPYMYKAARHCLKWGDMLPLDYAKRPTNIRRALPPTSAKGE